MFVIHGTYQFRPKRTAFRNDYCDSHGGARRSIQTRTFDAIHIFWIPIVPLGFWNRWICTACNRQTSVSTRTRRPFKWAGLIVLLCLGAMFWAAPLPADFIAGGWRIRIGAPLGAIFLLIHLFRTSKNPSRADRLRTIPTAIDTVCPLCGRQLLILASRCSCPVCGVIRS